MEKFAINWEDEYNIWMCASDELLEGLMLNAAPNASGLVLTIDEATFKISRPDSILLLVSHTT